MNSNYPVFTEDNLSIQLESCKQTGNKVKCELVFLSEEKDLQLYFYGSLKSYTKFYDEQGNKFKSSLVKIANNSNSTQISTILIADIPMKGFVSFDVEREIESISKIEHMEKCSSRITSSHIFLNMQF